MGQMQTENPDSKVIRPQPGKKIHNACYIKPLKQTQFVNTFARVFIVPLSLSPLYRHVRKNAVRVEQPKSIRKHLSVKLGPAAPRTRQRGAFRAAPIRRSQQLQSSHESWRATH